MRISIFFPAYNEQENIGATVDRAETVMSRLVLSGMVSEYELMIIDDGSSDQTPIIADELSARHAHVRVIHHQKNMGYGAALWSGIQAARFEWVFFTDADLQFRLEEIEKLIPYAHQFKAVLGFRSPRRDPFMRLANAKGWNMLNRLLFGLKVRDIDCAFKLMDSRLVASLPIQSRGAAISAEILIRMQRAGVAFKEVPVTHLPRKAGSPTGAKLSVIARAFKELLGLYMGDLGRDDTAYVQAGKFGLVGVVNTGVDVITYFILTRFMPFFPSHILMAKFTTFFFGTVTSFLLNRRFTFKVRGRFTAAELAKFYSTAALSVAVNVASLYVFNTLFGIYDLIAVGMSTVFTFAIGFAFSKLWVFKKAPQAPERSRPGKKRALAKTFESMKHRLRADKIDWNEIARASNE
ncbi:MAG: bifunctional glycosyltransferase family 2/GtrA family protein [Patescibacteria group bacterium]|nr:glycosyltransferase [Patescibacteria group bacterium]MDE1966653.1 bifunctional glycosyltransferase family 2/GtrA family protein [Patescibacteria group bacterium]